MAEIVHLSRDGDVALIVLNRPESRNAMNVALAAATSDAVRDSQDAAVIVITGADPAFCAGLDLRSLGTESMTDLPPFNQTVAESAVPTIAAVNGPAVTGGFELALACDFIVASERAAFADTHLRVGVYPGPVLVDLPRRVGMAWAREMSLTGNFVDAATAERIGIANHVVPHDELVPYALELARAIAEQDREMVARMRRDWDASTGVPIEEARRIHAEHQRGGSLSTSESDIAQYREAVLARSREQRKQGT
ncbi:MAG: enoyl-CoA hydratase [Acidimicrobiia bacterium]